MEKKVATLIKALNNAPACWREEMIEDFTATIDNGFELYSMMSFTFRDGKYPVTPFMEYDREVYFFAKVEGKDFQDNDILVTDFGERVARSWGGRIIKADFNDPLW